MNSPKFAGPIVEQPRSGTRASSGRRHITLARRLRSGRQKQILRTAADAASAAGSAAAADADADFAAGTDTQLHSLGPRLRRAPQTEWISRRLCSLSKK